MSNITTLVPFYGNNLVIVNHNSEPFVVMKSVVEGMGMVWAAQFVKLKQRFSSTVSEIEIVAQDGRLRAMTCLPLRKFFGWMMTINPNKVNPDIKVNIITYQNECDDVLWDYWNKGEAINPRLKKEKTRKALPNGLTIEQQDTIKAFHKELVGKVPKNKQASMAITLWSSIKSKYGVSYKEVPPEEFTAVVSLMSRVAVEKGILHGEVLDDDFQHSLFDIPKKKALDLDLNPFPESVLYDDFGERALTYKGLCDLYGEKHRGQVPLTSLLRQLESHGYDTSGCWMEYSGLRHLLRNTHQRLERVQDFLYMPVCAKLASN